MLKIEKVVQECLSKAGSRFDLWIEFINATKIATMLEAGVYRGDFAEKILKNCKKVEQYYMLDPWRHLDEWNKPANEKDDLFEECLAQTKARTDFASQKRVLLRGKTTEVIGEIHDSDLDYAYIDADHTLKGITIDLISIFPKIRDGGWIGGDDFSETIWQHSSQYEPTLVFPFAVYFAEAVDARIFALPMNQFLIEKRCDQGFEFLDLTGKYTDTGLSHQLNPGTLLKLKLREMF